MRSLHKVLWLCMVTLLYTAVAPCGAADAKIDLHALAAKRMPALLEFGRGWCIPCKYVKPILADMSRAYAGKAVVTSVDMDANRKLVRDFRIRMMPTQVFLNADGKEFFRHEGTLERAQIVEIFASMGVAQPGQGPATIRVPEQAQPPSPGGKPTPGR